MSKYYILPNFQYYSQQNTKWCWAACFSMTAKQLNLHNGSNEQLDFVKSYLSNPSCTINSNSCNKTISGNDVVLELNYKNITAVKTPVSSLNTFTHITGHLKANKAPWLLGIIDFNYVKHMVLIVGFGQCDNQNYYLIADPLNRIVYCRLMTKNFSYQLTNNHELWALEASTSSTISKKLIEKSTFAALFNDADTSNTELSFLISEHLDNNFIKTRYFHNDKSIHFFSEQSLYESCDDEILWSLVEDDLIVIKLINRIKNDSQYNFLPLIFNADFKTVGKYDLETNKVYMPLEDKYKSTSQEPIKYVGISLEEFKINKSNN